MTTVRPTHRRRPLSLAALLALAIGGSGLAGCQSSEDPAPAGGSGGARAGGSGAGGRTGSGGSSSSGSGGAAQSGGSSGGGQGGSAGSGQGGASGAGGAGTGGVAGGSGGASGAGGSRGGSGGGAGDAGPVTTDGGSRPDVMGAACATGSRYAFTVRDFAPQTGVFTAYFTARPSKARTNSVIGLSDGRKYLHDDYAAIVRFAENGNLDVRNGAAYMSMTPIVYKVTDYHFRLVMNVPMKTYSAYVSWDGMPEVVMGTNMAYRDSAPAVTKLSAWGVEAVASDMTRVCDFLVVPQ